MGIPVVEPPPAVSVIAPLGYADFIGLSYLSVSHVAQIFSSSIVFEFVRAKAELGDEAPRHTDCEVPTIATGQTGRRLDDEADNALC